jgi:AbrB-like transcriptional regulator
MAPVTGKDLLKKVEELKGTPKKEMARALGFASKTKTGQERVKLASFMNALLEAKGVGFGGRSERDGRSASYRIQVQQNGNLLVGAAYTREMGLEPGIEVEIQLGYKHIKLTPVKKEEIAEVSALSDNELKKMVDSKMPLLQDERLHLLLDKQQEGNLNIEERRELRHLMKKYTDGMLKKSEALAQLRKTMDEISAEVTAKGLTPEILESILHNGE